MLFGEPEMYCLRLWELPSHGGRTVSGGCSRGRAHWRGLGSPGLLDVREHVGCSLTRARIDWHVPQGWFLCYVSSRVSRFSQGCQCLSGGVTGCVPPPAAEIPFLNESLSKGISLQPKGPTNYSGFLQNERKKKKKSIIEENRYFP